jgi:2,4-dienoyl-CoA reductase-like NADH-dependent reductase (Old Yellow Enzyme family)
VLVRYNPESDEAVNRRQAARLRELADYVHKSNQHFMFELLVPMTQERRRSATRAIRWEVLRPAPSTQLNHHVLCQAAMKASPTARERRAGRCGYFTAYFTALRHEDG